MVFLRNLYLAAPVFAAYQHSHALNVPSIEVDNFDDEGDVHWEVEYRTETIYPPTHTAYTTVYYTPPNPATVYATLTSVSVVTQLATVTQVASVTIYAPPVTVTQEVRPPKHAFNGDAIIKHHPQHMHDFNLPSPVGSAPAGQPYRNAVFVTTTIMDAAPTTKPSQIVRANVMRAPCGCGGDDSTAITNDSGSATTDDTQSGTLCAPTTTTSCLSATQDSVPELWITTAVDSDSDNDVLDYEPATCISRSRYDQQQYEHQYGDDTMDFILDTKDHTRQRLQNSKERAKEALSHVRPYHIHNRIAQVVHDERPEIGIRHERKHSRSRKYAKSNIRHDAGCGCPAERVVKAPCDIPEKAPCAPPVKAPCAPPVKAPCAPPVKAPCAPPAKAPCAPPAKAPCAPPVKAPCDYPDREHQYGDDTMQFVLNTKDHVRSRWGSFKERTKSALSHFAPGHVHDRTSQLLHDERPEISEDHADLHARKGRRY